MQPKRRRDMKKGATAGLIVLVASLWVAAEERVLDELRWQHRIVVTTAESDSKADALRNQLVQSADQLAERRLIVVINTPDGTTVLPAMVTLVPEQTLALRQRQGRHHTVLIGLDGQTKQIYSRFQLDRVFGDIDSMPMRRTELLNTK